MSDPKAKVPPPRFVGSATHWEGLPDLGLPEIAFAGRSNVGKSSLLGMFLGQPKLVRTSRTPGRTQTLNLFVFEEQISLVDLPGYGFAKLSQAQRNQLSQMLGDYFRGRPGLYGVVVLVDSRLPKVSPLDVATVSSLRELGRSVLVVATKTDAITKNKLGGVLAGMERELDIPKGSLVPTSSKTGAGRDMLRNEVLALARATVA